MKKLVSILCVFALVFGLAGCGQEEKKPEKKVTITIAAAASLEKTFEETKMFELFVTNFDAKIGLYSSDVEIGPDFPYDAFRMVIKSVLRGAVSFVKEHETAMADTVAIHCVDEKNNFITAMVISEEADDEGYKTDD